MIETTDLTAIDFFQGIDTNAMAHLAEGAEVRELAQGEILLHQHDRAIALFFLLSGKVQFLIHVAGMDDLLVGTDREAGALIGWSVFRAPYRHTLTVRCETPCRFLRLSRTVFLSLFERDPAVGEKILRRVAEVLARRLAYNRDRLIASSGTEGDPLVEPAKLPLPTSPTSYIR
ncbi:MAG: cyclic nucleotide-binding domain-containing protein [Candidatus Thiodiazotropha sp. (ex Gloverina cf. vestifex)]|nr:cyclic nucleotide-binding domain-containing protein [Candidatus Thiodiazotropha sp. (ex Gloverina cf. vestifex)]